MLLPYFRAFLSVAGTGSITQSSEEIFKAPSAITRAIMELEKSLDSPLFERSSRGMIANAYGEAVRRRVLRVQEEIKLAAEEFCQKTNDKPTPPDQHIVSSMLYSERRLQLLISLAEHQQVLETAYQLGMTQSGVSMALTRFEHALGQPLFLRLARGMVPTEPALRLLVRAKRVLAELRHMGSDIAAIQGVVQGTVTIGALPLGRTLLLPGAVSAALNKHKQLKIQTIESPYEALLTGLRSGDIDFIFGALRPLEQSQGITNQALFMDELSIVCRRGHPLTRRPSLTLADILDQQWMLPRRDAPARKQLEATFVNAGLAPPQPAVETGDLAMLRALLERSDIITAISVQQLWMEIDNQQFEVLPIQLPQTQRQIGLMTRQGSLLSPPVISVMQQIHEVVQLHIPAGQWLEGLGKMQ